MDADENADKLNGPPFLHTLSLLRINSSVHSESSLASPLKTPLSPLGDESVRGYANDTKPRYHGAREIVSVVQAIESKGISCCVVGEAALIYYGAKRVMFDWLICVPTEDLSNTTDIFKGYSDQYTLFKPSALNVFGSLNSHFPRFKLANHALFFVIMSSQACHLDVLPQNIEYDRWIRIPYPKLVIYAQSLLDTWNMTSLEDLIDGMNLTVEWGEQNLDLDGIVDQAWACWRETTLARRELQHDELPQWSEPKRNIWMRVASNDAKRQRQGWKARPEQLTRFWISGQEDPRNKTKDYT